MRKVTKADAYLHSVYKKLRLTDSSSAEKYEQLHRIVHELNLLNDKKKIPVSTTGAISERLCKLALADLSQQLSVRRQATHWLWLGDYVIAGIPYDITVSVKSYTAKERLISSGIGSVLAPTIGWGLFKDATEWNVDRVWSYAYRGFVAIYAPDKLLNEVSEASKQVPNLNGRPMLRSNSKFPVDLKNAIHATQGDRIDCRML